jgi:hypothetical protein
MNRKKNVRKINLISNKNSRIRDRIHKSKRVKRSKNAKKKKESAKELKKDLRSYCKMHKQRKKN